MCLFLDTDNKEKENGIRTITKINIKEDKDKIIIKFTGNGFLRYQVRNMVGLLIKIGENHPNLKVEEI